MAFRGSAAATAFLAVAIVLFRRFPRPARTVAVVIAVVLAAYAAFIQWGPPINSDDGLPLQATAQKIMFAVSLAGMAYLSLIGERVATEARRSERRTSVETL